jgi:hypothetical protein
VQVVIAPTLAQVRVPAAYQLYSRLYYEDRVKDKVDAEIQGQDVSDKDRLATRARILRETYNAESPEVKAEIEKERQDLLTKLKQDTEALETMLDPTKAPHTPEEFAKYVLRPTKHRKPLTIKQIPKGAEERHEHLFCASCQ